jgi:DNA-directed RNA polymerase specialized sigma24 family protein
MSNANDSCSEAFPTTQWTQIIAVMQHGTEAAARQALEAFCEQYRPAIHSFFLRRGCTPENAGDYTQDFFVTRILVPWDERNGFLHQARRSEQGRFRSFLCWMLWNFLRDQFKKGGLRGGARIMHIPLEDWLPFEAGADEKDFARFGREFDRIFALEIIRKATDQSRHSHYLMAHLRGEMTQAAAAESLGITEGAFKLAYFRFRKRLAKNLWEEVGKLAGPNEADIRAEIQHLMSLFAEPAV